MILEKILENIFFKGGEEFILCRDEKHAESMRVTAFNTRRKMPELMQEVIGVQTMKEDGKFFVRIFKREFERWVRDPETQKLIPAPAEENDSEIARIVEMMKSEGKSKEEIEEYLNN